MKIASKILKIANYKQNIRLPNDKKVSRISRIRKYRFPREMNEDRFENANRLVIKFQKTAPDF